jgi:biopolymer transport protein ExbD
MAMSVGSSEEGAVMAEINTTPLVDVMLVLLIIFLITIPVISNFVPVELPKATNIPTETKPENITISVDVDGQTYWNEIFVENRDELLQRLINTAGIVPQPEVHIRGHKDARYEHIGRVVVLCQRASIFKVGFITEADKPKVRR